MQHGEIVGVGGEGMGHPVLGFDFGREDRAGVDAASLGGEQPAPPAEHRRQSAFPDHGHLPDCFELVFVEPGADVVGDIGEHDDRIRSEELSFVAREDGEVGEVGEVREVRSRPP